MSETPESTPQSAPHKAPAAPAAPAGRAIDEILAEPIIAQAASSVRGAILEAKEFAGEITLLINVDRIVDVCQAFKAASYTYLVDLTGVDYSKYPGHAGHRFGVTYTLYSFEKNARVRLRVRPYDTLPMPSVTSVWKTANWHERETFDMFGIVFDGHPNLERILMWDEFKGYPLRKDFPLRGVDTGARIYPEVFPEGGGPKAGATGKPVDDVNLFGGPWQRRGLSPAAGTKGGRKPAPELANVIAPTAKPTAGAPWHSPDLALEQRMKLAADRDLRSKLFAAMAQTDCGACGWDCAGYASALSIDETKDSTLCIPGGKETEATLKALLKEAGK